MGAHLGRTGAGRANLQGNEERAEGLRLPEGFGPIRLRLPGAPALLRPETLAALGQTGPTFPRHPRVSAAHSAHASQSVLGRSGPLPVCACASTIAVPEFSASCCALLSVQRWDGLFFFRFSAVVGVWQEFEGAKKGIGNVKREDSTCAKHIPRIGPRLGDAEWALRRALQPWEWTPAQAEGQGLAGWGLCAWAELKGSVLQISTRAQLSGRGRGEQLRTIVFLTQTHPARWKPGWRADGPSKVIILKNIGDGQRREAEMLKLLTLTWMEVGNTREVSQGSNLCIASSLPSLGFPTTQWEREDILGGGMALEKAKKDWPGRWGNTAA
ncbi:uncharacterized protein [Gorilla gorilla gorilla]|uniref:uncharacterized protein isoform X1 n=1 Tax=Gorilla gorilla gorilla TaxID=9595 RepID=UPI002446362E|nr:uncharacterized protein LOC101128836 isoform X1 [Gorilla gorilla gorilla]XP_055226242.1 uncharacterized protein LOC101128836 isoform X1 [Gorilla gorilla gorilla]